MKKVILRVLSIVLTLALLTVVGFAGETAQIKIYDFDGNLVENPDLSRPYLYGAVFNADGSIAPMPYVNLVDSEITLSVGQTWQSYQYAVSSGGVFAAGIQNPSTMSGDCKITVQRASSVGGSRTNVSSLTVKPTSEYGDAYVTVDTSSSYYYNATYKNLSSSKSLVSINIGT